MSKSLEALERLGAEKLARGELIRNDSKVEPYINCIKQDLEAYEQLQKENQELKEEMETLKKYDMELFATTFKLTKAIKILKSYLWVSDEVSFDTYFTSRLSDDEQDLLKEVLKC